MAVKILYFYGPHCAPCKTVGPALDKLAQDTGVLLEKLDAESDARVAEQYDISALPTVLFSREGGEIVRLVGGQPPSRYRKALEKVMQS